MTVVEGVMLGLATIVKHGPYMHRCVCFFSFFLNSIDCVTMCFLRSVG